MAQRCIFLTSTYYFHKISNANGSQRASLLTIFSFYLFHSLIQPKAHTLRFRESTSLPRTQYKDKFLWVSIFYRHKNHDPLLAVWWLQCPKYAQTCTRCERQWRYSVTLFHDVPPGTLPHTYKQLSPQVSDPQERGMCCLECLVLSFYRPVHENLQRFFNSCLLAQKRLRLTGL